jgi:hypothetical protein
MFSNLPPEPMISLMEAFRTKWTLGWKLQPYVEPERCWLLVVVGRVSGLRGTLAPWRYRRYNTLGECVDACEHAVAVWDKMGISFEEALATGPDGQQVCVLWHGKISGRGLFSIRAL